MDRGRDNGGGGVDEPEAMLARAILYQAIRDAFHEVASAGDGKPEEDIRREARNFLLNNRSSFAANMDLICQIAKIDFYYVKRKINEKYGRFL